MRLDRELKRIAYYALPVLGLVSAIAIFCSEWGPSDHRTILCAFVASIVVPWILHESSTRDWECPQCYLRSRKHLELSREVHVVKRWEAEETHWKPVAASYRESSLWRPEQGATERLIREVVFEGVRKTKRFAMKRLDIRYRCTDCGHGWVWKGKPYKEEL